MTTRTRIPVRVTLWVTMLPSFVDAIEVSSKNYTVVLVVAIVVVVLILCVVAIYYCCRKRGGQQNQQNQSVGSSWGHPAAPLHSGYQRPYAQPSYTQPYPQTYPQRPSGMYGGPAPTMGGGYRPGGYPSSYPSSYGSQQQFGSHQCQQPTSRPWYQSLFNRPQNQRPADSGSCPHENTGRPSAVAGPSVQAPEVQAPEVQAAREADRRPRPPDIWQPGQAHDMMMMMQGMHNRPPPPQNDPQHTGPGVYDDNDRHLAQAHDMMSMMQGMHSRPPPPQNDPQHTGPGVYDTAWHPAQAHGMMQEMQNRPPPPQNDPQYTGPGVYDDTDWHLAQAHGMMQEMHNTAPSSTEFQRPSPPPDDLQFTGPGGFYDDTYASGSQPANDNQHWQLAQAHGMMQEMRNATSFYGPSSPPNDTHEFTDPAQNGRFTYNDDMHFTDRGGYQSMYSHAHPGDEYRHDES